MNPLRSPFLTRFIAALIMLVPLCAYCADAESIFTRWPYPGGTILSESIAQHWSPTAAQAELRRRLARDGFDRLLVIALGIVGDRSDIYFIRALEAASLAALPQKSSEASSIALNARYITEATLWATARLGDADSLRSVAERLSPPNPQEPKFNTANRWKDYGKEMLMAAYIGDRSRLAAMRDPVRNIWIVQCGLIMCALVPVLAGICLPIRGLPGCWFLIDCAFAPTAALPLWLALRDIQQAEAGAKAAN